MTDLETLKHVFTDIGVKFEECEERVLNHPPPVATAEKFLSVEIAHFHFDAAGKYLGAECNGNGDFKPAVK